MFNFFKGLLEALRSVVTELIVLAAIGLFVAWMGGLLGLQSWARNMVLGLFAAVLVWAAITTVIIAKRHFASRHLVSSENVQTVLWDWIHKFHFLNQPMADNPGLYHFSYMVNMPAPQGTQSPGLAIFISRPLFSSGNYLTFRCPLPMGPEQQTRFNQLSDVVKKKFNLGLRAGCLNARVSVNLPALDSTQPFDYFIEHFVPITASFTEHEFLNTLNLVKQDAVITATQMEICLDKAAEQEARITRPLTPILGTEALPRLLA